MLEKKEGGKEEEKPLKSSQATYGFFSSKHLVLSMDLLISINDNLNFAKTLQNISSH